MRSYNKHIAFLYLIFFISIKFIGLHVLSHDNDKLYEDCEICEYVIVTNEVPFVANGQILLRPSVECNYNILTFYGYSCPALQNKTSTNLFCRPPPAV